MANKNVNGRAYTGQARNYKGHTIFKGQYDYGTKWLESKDGQTIHLGSTLKEAKSQIDLQHSQSYKNNRTEQDKLVSDKMDSLFKKYGLK